MDGINPSMKEVQTPLLGSLYFNTTPREYVAPPVAAIKALGKAKEEDYLKTAANLNEIETIKRNLPSQYSPELAATITDVLERASSSITPDNYSDRVLDTTQLAYDLKNNMGIQNLIDQQKAVADADAAIKAAKEKDEIVDPAHEALIRQRAKESVKPLTIDPATGLVTKQGAINIAYNKFYDIQEESLKNLAGWKADKTIITDPATGKLRVKGNLPGYLGFAKETVIDEGELLQRLAQYHKANPKFQAYMSDITEAEMMQRPIVMSGADILSRITKTTKANIAEQLGKKEVTPEDLDALIANGTLTPERAKTLIKSDIIDRRVAEGSAFAAAKESYREEDQDWFTDIISKENRDFLKDIAKIREAKPEEKPGEALPFIVGTDTVSNPAAMATTTKLIADTTSSLNQAQIDYNNFKATYDVNDPVQKQELLNKQNVVNQLKGELANAKTAQQSQADDIINTGKKRDVGVDVMAEYNKAKPELLNHIRKENFKALTDTQFTVDISNKVINKGGKLGINTPDGFVPLDKLHGRDYRDGKYYIDYRPGYNTWNMLGTKTAKQILLDNEGNINKGRIKNANISANKLSRLQTPQEFKVQVLSDFTKGKTGAWFGDKTALEAADGKTVYMPNNVREAIDKIREKTGGIVEKGSKPLVALAGTGKLGKDIEETSNLLNKVFEANKGAWKVFDSTTGSSTDIGTQLKQQYGITLNPTDIDDKNTKIIPTVETDSRGYPIMVMKIRPSAAALKAHEGDALTKAVDSDGYISLNVTSDNPAVPKVLYNTLRKNYRTLATGDTGIDVINKQESARGAFLNSPQGQAIQKLNIGSMIQGESKPIQVGNTHFNIKASGTSGSQGDIGRQAFSITGYSNDGPTSLVRNSKGQEAMMTNAQLKANPDYKVFTMPNENAVYSTLGTLLLKQDKTKNPYTLKPGKTTDYKTHTIRRYTRY